MNNNVVMRDLEEVSMAELKEHFPNKRALTDFFITQGKQNIFKFEDLFMPKESMFDFKFGVAVLQGKKKVTNYLKIKQLLSIPSNNIINLTYSKKDKALVTSKLIALVKKDQELLKYLPEGIKEKRIPRNFLLALIKQERPVLYEELKIKESEIKGKRKNVILEKHKILIPKKMKDAIEKFPPYECSAKELKSTFVKTKKKNEKIGQ